MICLTVPTSVAQGPDQQSETPKAPAKDPFSMDMQSLLDMKVTTASKFPEKLSAAPGVISVVTREDLRRFGGLTLGEILERVPGLAGSTASFTDRSIVAARGDQTKINGGHILFLINGRPTREVLEGGLIGDLLESFPVEILERIEVIKGPGSVLYGSNAFSAVVNLITQKADGDRLVVTGSGASQEGAATSAQAMFQRGDFSLVAAGEFHQQPIWNTLYHSQFLGLQNVSIPDRAKGSYLDVNYKGLTLMSAFTDFETDYTEGAAGQARWRRTFADLGYALKPKDNWDMNFNFTYNPKPGAYDLLSANLRYDLSKLLHAHGKTGAAFIAHANNLTNKQIWLPDWKDGPGESTFYNRGRALYFGIELSIRKE